VKGEGATMRYRVFSGIFFLLVLLSAAAAYPADVHRLKPGAKGKICANCHVDFQEKLKRPFLLPREIAGGRSLQDLPPLP